MYIKPNRYLTRCQSFSSFLCQTTMHQWLLCATLALAAGAYSAHLDVEHFIPIDYSAPGYDQESPMPYIFGYAVTDSESFSNFDHHESSDAQVITGSYRVALPDGRTQIVTYTADDNGYVADVKYEGEAKYPEHRKGH